MNHYFMKLSARILCSCCKSKILVEVSEELTTEADYLSDLDDQIREAIESQQNEDGWFSDWCPKCAKDNAREIHLGKDADDYCSNKNDEY